VRCQREIPFAFGFLYSTPELELLPRLAGDGINWLGKQGDTTIRFEKSDTEILPLDLL